MRNPLNKARIPENSEPIQEQDPIAGIPDKVQIMGGDYFQMIEFVQDMDQVLPIPGIQRDGGLIHQQNIRRHG